MAGQDTHSVPTDGDGHRGTPPRPTSTSGAALGESEQEYEKVVGGPT